MVIKFLLRIQSSFNSGNFNFIISIDLLDNGLVYEHQFNNKLYQVKLVLSTDARKPATKKLCILVAQ